VTASVRQYKREYEVIVGQTIITAAGVRLSQGLSVKDLRVTFEITKSIGSTPNTALVKIYNLNQDSENKVVEEFDEILINAGYAGSSLLIFRGNIRHRSPYRDGNDRIMEIDAADGDYDARHAIVNTTLKAGTTTSQFLDQIVGKFKTTKRGHVTLKDQKRIRGKVISGSARDHLDELARQADAHWSIQDGLLEIVPVDSTLPTEAIVINSDTGMKGAPEVSDKGVKVTCLLNPRIRINGKIKIDNNDLKLKIKKEREKKPGGTHVSKTTTKKVGLSRIDPDGVYKVIHLVHKGDTRGDEWETEVIGMPLPGKSIPAGKGAA
jgi:hypothetical protein